MVKKTKGIKTQTSHFNANFMNRYLITSLYFCWFILAHQWWNDRFEASQHSVEPTTSDIVSAWAGGEGDVRSEGHLCWGDNLVVVGVLLQFGGTQGSRSFVFFQKQYATKKYY